MIQLVQQLESYAHLEPLLHIDITSIIEKYTKLVEERDINYDFDVIINKYMNSDFIITYDVYLDE